MHCKEDTAQSENRKKEKEWFSPGTIWRDNYISPDANILACEKYNWQIDRSFMP